MYNSVTTLLTNCFANAMKKAWVLLPLCMALGANAKMPIPHDISDPDSVKTLEAPSAVVTTTQDTIDPSDGIVSLREAMLYALSQPSVGRIITFSLPLGSSHTILLTAPLPPLQGDTLEIHGEHMHLCINGGDSHQLFRLQNNAYLSLHNISLAHGHSFDGMGGAVYCHGSTLIMDSCRLVHNRVSAPHTTGDASAIGGAIYANGNASIILRNTLLDSNAAEYDIATGFHAYGGAVATLQSANILVENCRFEGNNAECGGAIFAQATSSWSNPHIQVNRSCFCGNSATTHGGAIDMRGVNSWTHNSTFYRNHAPRGGAVYVGGNLDRVPSITSCTFVENGITWDTAGNSIYIDGEDASLQLCNNIVIRSLSSANTHDIRVLGNSNAHSWNDLCTTSDLPPAFIHPLNIPDTIVASAQVCTNPYDTVVNGVLHHLFPPLKRSVAATMGVAVGLQTGTSSITTHWQPSTSGGSWKRNTNGSVIAEDLVVVDSLDEIGNMRPPAGNNQCVGSLHWQCLMHDNSSTMCDTACDSYPWHDSLYTASTHNTQYTTYNSVGCDSTVTLHLTINYSRRDTIVDSATSSYQWQGETYTESGEYLFEGHTVAGCDSVVVLQLTITEIGIAPVNPKPDITFYPNPTKGILTIVAPEVKKIEVFDPNGRLYCTHHNSNTINLNNLPSGIYTLRATLHEGIAVKRVIVK